jgi:hypothetical protein
VFYQKRCIQEAEIRDEIQFFTWDSYDDEMSWWKHLETEIPNLAAQGFTQVWLPPPNKAAKPRGQGYDAYDLVYVIRIPSRFAFDRFCSGILANLIKRVPSRLDGVPRKNSYKLAMWPDKTKLTS